MRARWLFLTPLSLLLYSTFLIGGCGGGDATGPDPKPTTGSLTLQIQGLPTGAAASIQVSGPGNYGSAVPASTTLSSLAAGQYQVTVSPVTTTSYSFTPSNTGQAVTVGAGETPGRQNASVAGRAVREQLVPSERRLRAALENIDH